MEAPLYFQLAYADPSPSEGFRICHCCGFVFAFSVSLSQWSLLSSRVFERPSVGVSFLHFSDLFLVRPPLCTYLFFFVNSIKLVSFRQSVVRIVGIVELRFGATNFTQRLQVPSSASVIWLAHKAESSGYSEQHTEHHSEFRFCLIIRSFVSSFILTAVLLCLPNIRTNFPLYSDF